jgi:tetratricopeptide (TPR) repeat protein
MMTRKTILFQLLLGFLLIIRTDALCASQSTPKTTDQLELTHYPITKALHVANEIKQSLSKKETPLDTYYTDLHLLSTDPTIAGIIIDIAHLKHEKKQVHKIFANDWYYYRAISLSKRGFTKRAVQEIDKLNLKDRYFSQGLYLRAMFHLELKEPEQAIAALNAVLMPETQIATQLLADDFGRLLSHTHLALARIHYQQKSFLKAVKHYRAIDKRDPNFYNALFEQSWALFLAGYPPYALGSLYGVQSPFFKERYNPEAPLLDSIVYYWICQYDHGKEALKRFENEYKHYSQSLRAYTARLRFTPQQGFGLLDDFLSGVSSQSLGIERQLLANAAEREHIRNIRLNLAAAQKESQRIKRDHKVSRQLKQIANRHLTRFQVKLRTVLGKAFVLALKEQAKEFKNLHEQSEFLKIEMLFGEKEQLLGQKLQANLGVKNIDQRDLRQWTTREQTWAADNLNEYWWDEIGFQTIAINDQCKE